MLSLHVMRHARFSCKCAYVEMRVLMLKINYPFIEAKRGRKNALRKQRESARGAQTIRTAHRYAKRRLIKTLLTQHKKKRRYVLKNTTPASNFLTPVVQQNVVQTTFFVAKAASAAIKIKKLRQPSSAALQKNKTCAK